MATFEVIHPDCHDLCRDLLAQMRSQTPTTTDHLELTFFTKDRQEVIIEDSIHRRYQNSHQKSGKEKYSYRNYRLGNAKRSGEMPRSRGK